VQRELLLVKVRCDQETRAEVLATVQLFRAKIVDVAPDAVTVEATGDSEKIEALLRVLEPFGVKELVQSGMVAIGRGSRSIADRPLRTVTPEDVRAHHEGGHANGSRDTHNRTHRKQMSDHHG
jgi:acetolactate synthase-1/3 small subunit